MRITHVISDGNVGGAGILVSAIASALADEFETELIIPRGSSLASRIECEHIKLTELPFAADKSLSYSSVPTFYRYLRANPCHVLHSHASLAARLGGRLAGIPCCISTRHCAISADAAHRLPYHKRRLYSLLTDLTVSTADCATDNLICEGVDPARIRTIKNGSKRHEKLNTGAVEAKRRQLGIPQTARIVGCVGRLEDVKGQDLILRAAPRMLHAHPDLYFLFVGTGSRGARYRELASVLGLGDRVIFTGYTPTPWEYQSLFYININPSRGTETSCLATSECMAMGIPTVASDFGGNREMIEDGVCGLLFPADNPAALASAACRVLDDGELYSALSRGAALCYNQKFSEERMIDEYRELYRALGARILA